MRPWWWVWASLAASVLLLVFGLRGTPAGAVRKIVEKAANATEAGVNRRDLSKEEGP